jgi:NarL family two-component system sensor histidine kinase YdfH
VQDNGMGFGPDEVERAHSASHGAGLVGIRERARILGGRVEIRSGVPRGTTITVTLPLEGATHG